MKRLKKTQRDGSLSLRRIGVHTSIAGGVHLSLERAEKLGCNTMQIFSHSPRSWLVRKITEEEIYEFKRLRYLYDIFPIYIHTSYLINLASPNKTVAEKSIELLSKEMVIAEVLGAEYVVLHPGSASDSEEAGTDRIIKGLRKVLNGRGKTRVLLENTAGEKGDLTSRVSQLAHIIHSVDSDKIGGICIDTCHAFQAGYDISNKDGVARLMDEVIREIGMEGLKLIHINDSKRTLGCGVDRHEHIGIGHIGKDGFRTLLSDPMVLNVPVILETPKDTEEDDIRNLKIVRGLMDLT